jgi:hypothetical protein
MSLIRVRHVAVAAVALFGLTGCAGLLIPIADNIDTSNTQGDLIEESLNNTAPIARAGDDQRVVAGDLVILDGAGSSDPDADRLLYIWTQTDGEPTVELLSPFAAVTTFIAPADVEAPARLTFQLTTIDGIAAVSDSVQIIIDPAQ